MEWNVPTDVLKHHINSFKFEIRINSNRLSVFLCVLQRNMIQLSKILANNMLLVIYRCHSNEKNKEKLNQTTQMCNKVFNVINFSDMNVVLWM